MLNPRAVNGGITLGIALSVAGVVALLYPLLAQEVSLLTLLPPIAAMYVGGCALALSCDLRQRLRSAGRPAPRPVSRRQLKAVLLGGTLASAFNAAVATLCAVAIVKVILCPASDRIGGFAAACPWGLEAWAYFYLAAFIVFAPVTVATVYLQARCDNAAPRRAAASQA